MTMKTFFKLAVAACVALAIGLVFLTNPGGRALAFAEVIEQVKQAKSVRYKSVINVEMPGGKSQTTNATTVVTANRMRQELPGMVQLMDVEKGEMLVLQTNEKTGMRVTMKNKPAREGQPGSMNLLEQFRLMKPDQAKPLGLKTIDGRELRGFVVEQPGNTMTVWADPKTQEPVRIEAKINMPSVPSSTAVMTDFEWDVPVDPAKMSLDGPDGYTIQTMTVDASPPGETDLVDGLRAFAELSGGAFPESFDMAGIGKAVEKSAPKKPQTPKDLEAFKAERVPVIMKVSRAFAFMTSANGDEWHYAGAGAKPGEAGRAVLWYRPKGSDKYRVIHADLSVRDAAAGELPKVEAKKLTPGASPFSALQKPANPPTPTEPLKHSEPSKP
jgi:hypothetical protein